MPLSLLVPTVLLGLALIALTLWSLGFATPCALSVKRVQEAFIADQGRAADSVTLTGNRLAALVCAQNEYFVAWAMGADVVLRDLAGAILTDTAQGARITLPDFAAPRVNLSLSAQDRALWHEALT
ncbi:MAG: hypothetical protein ACRBCL_04520 [Maritimibacter sp.]